MKIAILGTGNMAAGLAEVLAPKHEVYVGGKDPAKAAAIADKAANGVIGGGLAAVVKLAEVVILALPYAAIAEVLHSVGDIDGKVLVDISNPVTEDFQNLSIGLTSSAAEEIQKQAPNAQVVKAFNTIFAPLLNIDARQNKQLQVFIASDYDVAKQVITEIVSSIAFKAVDAGALKNARFIEPIGMMNIQFGFFLGQGPSVAPTWVKI